MGQHTFPFDHRFRALFDIVARVVPFLAYATGLALYAVWWYATAQHRLVEKDLDPHIVTLAQNRTLIGPVVSLIGIGFSFLDTRISLVLYLLLIPFFIRPSHIDIHFRGGSHD